MKETWRRVCLRKIFLLSVCCSQGCSAKKEVWKRRSNTK